MRRRNRNGQEVHKKVSYIRKPFARQSKWSLGLCAAGLLLFAGAIFLAVREQGQSGMYVGPLGFSSIVFSSLGLWYSFRAFLEKEKNYILARISVSVCGLLLILWAVMIIIGIRS